MKKYIISATSQYYDYNPMDVRYSVALSGEYVMHTLVRGKDRIARGTFSVVKVDKGLDYRNKWKFIEEDNDYVSKDDFHTAKEAYAALIWNLKRYWFEPVPGTFKITPFSELMRYELSPEIDREEDW